jgi:hypothetical protein
MLKIMGFEITFRYDREPCGGGSTEVELRKDGITWNGFSFCHFKDNFVKEKGRKIALRKALSRTNLSKVGRTQFWKEYFGRKTAK